MEDEIAAWLRVQAEADIKAAGVATDGPWEYRDMQVWGATRAYVGGEPDSVLVARHTWPQEAGHITRHDPLTEAARAESVLAVLGEYETARAMPDPDPWTFSAPFGPSPLGAVALHANVARLEALARTVRLLAYGYRFRKGAGPPLRVQDGGMEAVSGSPPDDREFLGGLLRWAFGPLIQWAGAERRSAEVKVGPDVEVARPEAGGGH